MGAKGSKVQKITTDFNVQIKFPDKAAENGEVPAVTSNGDRLVPNKTNSKHMISYLQIFQP